MSIEKEKLSNLRIYKKNAKYHSPEKIEKLARLIEKFGFTNPIQITKDNVILAGHARYWSARKLNLEEVPVIRLNFSSNDQKAYRIFDNQIAETELGYDYDILNEELEELKKDNYKDFELFDWQDPAEEIEDLEEEKTEILRPYKKTHILLSFNPEDFAEIKPHIDKILENKNISYEQSSN